ncbi:hypothetical protein F7725_028843 [Dissostichus mawsoni]|uniref:Helix-turn-helix domain-containing protein n=1 Tax=Dissostichus mawsoni TaxID=36200 RepID=A0A7J5XGT0_DISMA|nr:hypothetical protein F7725_028843 [Dissostichus mawsoni]
MIKHASETFPRASIYIPLINHSPYLTPAQKHNILLINDSSPNIIHPTTPPPGSLPDYSRQDPLDSPHSPTHPGLLHSPDPDQNPDLRWNSPSTVLNLSTLFVPSAAQQQLLQRGLTFVPRPPPPQPRGTSKGPTPISQTPQNHRLFPHKTSLPTTTIQLSLQLGINRHTCTFTQNHPKNTFQGIIKSQIIRFHRISSKLSDFHNSVRILFHSLQTRGYSKRFLRHIKDATLAGLPAPAPTRSPPRGNPPRVTSSEQSPLQHPFQLPTPPAPTLTRVCILFPNHTTTLISPTGMRVYIPPPSSPLGTWRLPGPLLHRQPPSTTDSTTPTIPHLILTLTPTQWIWRMLGPHSSTDNPPPPDPNPNHLPLDPNPNCQLIPFVSTFSHTITGLHRTIKENFSLLQSQPYFTNHRVISAYRKKSKPTQHTHTLQVDSQTPWSPISNYTPQINSSFQAWKPTTGGPSGRGRGQKNDGSRNSGPPHPGDSMTSTTPPAEGTRVAWSLVTRKKSIILGDSNLSHIPSFSNPNLQIDSFPGAKFHHITAFLNKLSPCHNTTQVPPLSPLFITPTPAHQSSPTSSFVGQTGPPPTLGLARPPLVISIPPKWAPPPTSGPDLPLLVLPASPPSCGPGCPPLPSERYPTPAVPHFSPTLAISSLSLITTPTPITTPVTHLPALGRPPGSSIPFSTCGIAHRATPPPVHDAPIAIAQVHSHPSFLPYLAR